MKTVRVRVIQLFVVRVRVIQLTVRVRVRVI